VFNFEITALGNLFVFLSAIVFFTTFFLQKNLKDVTLYLLVFISVCGIFYASNFLTLFIFWEMMGWLTYFIVKQTASKEISLKYIIFNIAGGFSLLFAIVILYGYSNSFYFYDIDIQAIPLDMQYLLASLLFITIFIKSGILPFHYWIVDTYQRSNHIFSSFLSAIISKTGIYLFIIVFIQIGGFELNFIYDAIAVLGVATSIIATFKAINEDNMKRLLAYSSIAQLGYIVTIMVCLSVSSTSAALYYTIIHTLTKLLLFINIAAIIYATAQEKFSDLGALIYKYQYNFILLVIGIIALAGMPPLGGFSGKFLIYTSLLEHQKSLILIGVLFSSASAFLYCYKLVYGIYLGQEAKRDTQYKKIPFGFYISQTVAALLLILLGVFPSIIIPYINTILQNLGLSQVMFIDIYSLNTTFGAFNGFAIMGGFGLIFAVVLVLFLKGKVKSNKDRYDISYCGEVPNENTNLHYGYGMGRELSRIEFINLILKNSTKNFWNIIKSIIDDLAKLFEKIYFISIQNIVLLSFLFFTILLLFGVSL